jgi:hypothetical protein
VKRNTMGVRVNEHFRPFHFFDRKGGLDANSGRGRGCKFDRKGAWPAPHIMQGQHMHVRRRSFSAVGEHALQNAHKLPSVHAGEFRDLTSCRCCVDPEGYDIRECSRHLVLCRDILGGVHQARASLGYISFREVNCSRFKSSYHTKR